ncbi:MAG: hypothetical protein ABI423_00630, partial [Burkholderiales bacterium]
MDQVQDNQTTPSKRARKASAPTFDLETLRRAELLSVDQVCMIEPAFTPGGLRWLIFQASTNGLEKSGALVRVGRRVLLHQAKFREFLIAQGRAAHPAHQQRNT